MKTKVYFVLIGLALLFALVVFGGCSQLLIFDPQGPIGRGERSVIIAAFILMLIVVIPVLVMSFLFPWKYRASNSKATYRPKWNYSLGIDLAMWLVPVAIITALGALSWQATHNLDPYKPIDSGGKPIRIEVVSLDWNWLFIYPDFDIAVVNQLVFPASVPLSFKLTSDTVMTSFFIPQLGSQIYAMPGRQSRLHLLADEPGTYAGHNQQFSGRGYEDMHFKAIGLSRAQFDAWVQHTKKSPIKLDLARYKELAQPSVGHPVTFFSAVKPGLFEHIVRKYLPMQVDPDATGSDSGVSHVKTGPLGKG